MKAARFIFTLLVLAGAQRARAQESAPVAPEQPAAEAGPPDQVGTAAPATLAEPQAATPATGGTVAESQPEDAVATAAIQTEASVAEGDVAADDATSGDLTEAELAALGLNAEEQGLDTDLHFSGFMDVNYLQLLNPDDAAFSTRTAGTEGSMFVGRLNLYATKNITESFRMMTEVRFMYSPNGSAPLFSTSGATSTEVIDSSGTGANVRWGGIYIERAYGEWSALRYLTLRLGAFLTPYGIWNVDHGSPVVVPVMRPYAVNGAFFPEHQTGVEAFGRMGVGSKFAVRYHLTLSNGLGPVSEYRDLDKNKAIGGRLALEYVGASTFQIGGSAFYGENSGGTTGLGISADGTKLQVQRVVSDQAYVTAVAGDVLWKYRRLHLQSEWVGQRWQYTEAGRTPVFTGGQAGVPVNALPPDVFNWAGYVLVGYRLPWWGVMPFGTLEYQRSNNYGILTKTAFSQVGLNIRPADAIVLKLEYQFAFAGTEGTQVKVIAAQLAWAF
ncbi:MAG: hypothetical protein QM778_10630 [Myxococcales bacterium]